MQIADAGSAYNVRVTSECGSKWSIANTQRRPAAHLSNTWHDRRDRKKWPLWHRRWQTERQKHHGRDKHSL